MTTINRIIPVDAVGALDAALREALGAVCTGISTGKFGVEVHLTKDATAEDENAALQLVLTFDTSKRLPEQIARAENKRLRDAAYAKAQESKATSAELIDYLMLEVKLLRERLGEG